MMYSPAVCPCSSAAISVLLDLNHCAVGARPRGEYASASQYTLNVSTRPTSSAGQLSASTHLGAATRMATVKAILTNSHTMNAAAAPLALRDDKRHVSPRAKMAAGITTAIAP